jgi:nucleoside-diphosphate-sugar epimerase
MKLLVLGAGFCARRYLARFGGDLSHVAASARDDAARARLEAEGIEAVAFDAGLAARASGFDALLVSVPPRRDDDGRGDAALRALAGLERGPRRIVYLSTIGVYGDRAGEWVDETTPLGPVSPRSRARREAEEGWSALAARIGARIDLLRLAGIYGPGRNALAQLAAGTARRLVKPGQVFNRVHVDDVARAIRAVLLGAGEGGPLILADDEPAPPQDVIAFAAELLGVPAPPETPYDPERLTPMARSFYDECKRASNGRLRALAGPLDFPNYREGLRALRAAGEGAWPQA